MTTAATHIVQYSTGAGSAEVAWRVVAEHGADAVLLLTADTLVEDEDNWRFARQVVDRLGCEWVVLADGRTPMQVGRDVKVVPNNRLAVCSRILKRELLRGWIDEHCDPADTTIYLGFDWTETDRLDAARPHWQPYTIAAPLADPPYMSKPDLLQLFRDRGIEPPRLYAQGFAHANCLHPDTRFITDEGIKTLRETLGKTVRVLGKGGGWKEATIESFGEQELLEVTLRRYGDSKTVLATPEHRWPARLGRSQWQWMTTSELAEGQAIAGMYGQLHGNLRPSYVGVAAGFVYGDGCAPDLSANYTTPANVTICGEKVADLLPYFAPGPQRVVENVGVHVGDLPRSWKRLPDLTESKSYLYGWLAGYFAADGSFGKGSATISSASLSDLEFVRDVCAKLGIGTAPIRTAHRRGYGTADTALHHVALMVGTLRPDFFIRTKHRERFEARAGSIRPADWCVASVEKTGRVEEVMCAVVPDGHLFTLEDNLGIGNCGGGCVRGGQAQWALLLQVNRDRYLGWEVEEERTRTELGKDVSILRDRVGGPVKSLTLRRFRKRLDRQPGLFDADDVGACGCFTEVPA